MSKANGSSLQPGWLTRFVGRSKKLRKLCPDVVKRLGYRFLDMEGLHNEIVASIDAYPDLEEVSSYEGKVDVTLGIVKELGNRHKRYAMACKDLGVPYRMVDISGPDWLDAVRSCGCDGLLIWPATHLTVIKQMYDERLRIIVEDLRIPIYPGVKELWIYESKRRMAYWLEANDLPHCRTWVFYSRRDALEHVRTTILPVVTKTNLGAGAAGVNIWKDRRPLEKYVRRCFGRGIIRRKSDRRDREWGEVLFQEYIKDAAEWRVIRLGESYFAHQKVKKGKFHSGSGLAYWYDPPKKVLDLARKVTTAPGFTSMNIDILESPDGRLFVSELQPLFGTVRPYQMLVNGVAGRYVWNDVAGEWRFERGIFCQNACCNARVAAFLQQLSHSVEPVVWDEETTVPEEDRKASREDYARQHSTGLLT